MNVYRLTPYIFALEIYNVNFQKPNNEQGLSGHYDIFLNSLTNEVIVYKKGSFGSLSWFPYNDSMEFEVLSEAGLKYMKDYALDEFAHSRPYGEVPKTYPRNTIFDYQWDIFRGLHCTAIAKKAIEILSGFNSETLGEVCNGKTDIE